MMSRLLSRYLPVLAIGAAFSLCAAVPGAWAGLRNDVPSCYAANHIKAPKEPFSNLVYVLVDQTVTWNRQLERQIIETANSLMRPGTEFAVAQFSAFSQGRYLKVRHTGVLEMPLTKEQFDNTPFSKAGSFKACMRDQATYVAHMLDRSIAKAVEGSTSSLDQSDILAALATISKAVEASPAKRKVVIVATDGLENSSVESFYGRGTVRLINPDHELALAQKAGLLGDFGGARVYVIGGGMMPSAKTGTRAARDGYRDPQVMRALSLFWKGYFKKSNADLVEFGEPDLVVPASYGGG